MKTLTLLRHAKSGYDDPTQRDFDRALNAKGQRAAAVMGRQAKALGLAVDTIVASPAMRVVQTLENFLTGYGSQAKPEWDRRIYLASAATLLDLIQELPDTHDHVLLAGHNPGLEDLVLLLVPDGDDPLRDQVELKFPTASIAELTFDASDWANVAPGGGALTRFVRPRDVDPTLGPDHG
jgi:phosphohistidine phosphatase